MEMAFNVRRLDAPSILSMPIGDQHRRLRYTWLTTGSDVGQIDLANVLFDPVTEYAG